MNEQDRIHHVTIVGVGTQGSMIAFRNALHGKQVTGYSRTKASIQTCREKIDRWIRHYIQQGRLTQAQADEMKRRIHYASSLEAA
ncbi:MAG: 3-hydroxyacyl-CoA dehydrogenase NAD-binding domain-containing protein, partial [Bacillota bacterium]